MSYENAVPGPSNTPAQRTSDSCSHPVIARPLRILLDWLGFTVESTVFSVDVVLAMFDSLCGIPNTLWQPGRKNYEGYADSLRFENINIYYNGAENQGIHVDITGQGCRYIETRFALLGVHEYNWHRFIYEWVSTGSVKFTRVDIACDDFHGYFSVKQLFLKCLAGEVTSKFKSWSPDGNFSMDGLEGTQNGLTLYFGTKVSRIQAVFYEKNKQLGIDRTWTRTEIHFRHERAQEIIWEFLFRADTDPTGKHKDVGVIFAGILKHYITFRDRNPNDKNKRRWPVSEFWDTFLQDIEPLRLASALPDRSIIRMRTWINKQVSKSLTMLYFAYQDIPEFRDWFREVLKEGYSKLTEADKIIIDEFRNLYKKSDLPQLEEINATSI